MFANVFIISIQNFDIQYPLHLFPLRYLQYTHNDDEDKYRTLEESLLLFAVPCSWFYLLFFCGAIKLTGPFVTMIFKMVTGDMFTFAIIYTIMLLGFSQAFYFLIKEHEEAGMFSNYFTTWMGLFHMTQGDHI